MTLAAGYHHTAWIASERMSALNETFAADLVAVCLLAVVGLFVTGVLLALGFADEMTTALAVAG
jgi:hypothetical protein